jgi:hypothetical protein
MLARLQHRPFLYTCRYSQGSPLLPILFLFYHANLIDACNSLTLPVYETGFVDTVNALALANQ